jgi:hypothetical protein
MSLRGLLSLAALHFAHRAFVALLIAALPAADILASPSAAPYSDAAHFVTEGRVIRIACPTFAAIHR